MRGFLRTRLAVALFALNVLAACTVIPAAHPPAGTTIPKPPPFPAPLPPPPPPTALTLGVRAGPAIETLPLYSGRAAAALRSFIESCPRLTARNDSSGLTRTQDWQPACNAARTWPSGDAAAFFVQSFETARVGDGSTYVTGYYEPEIAGTRSAQTGFAVQVYRLPGDLVRAWPDEVPPEQRTGTPPLGRIDENGKVVLYYDRAAIEDGALAGRGLELAYAADAVEFFFLQIQGSGRLIAPDGSVMRIGYAGQNGREYVGIGSKMRAAGLIGSGPGQYPGSMQGIMAYLRANPDQGRALMRQNPSYVFFREVIGDGPIGALGVPVRGQASVAADPLFVPLGAPLWLSVDRAEVSGLWVAQDTGGAIKGANRFDSFWGAGPSARTIAGGMSARGDALLFLPRGTLARLGAR
ncbi:MAG: murein transglycosylase A [Novosphingobium sp.]